MSSSLPVSTPIRDSQTVQLSDGRTLGFAEYGSPTGLAIFFFHGLPGSRLDGAHFDALARKYGARIIGVDRPGIGLSTYQPKRKILDWPRDVSELARHLSISQYRILGASGGGPYALACAKVLPKEKLNGVGVLAGMGPWSMGTKGMQFEQRVLLNVMSWSSGLSRILLDAMVGKVTRDPNPQVLMDLITNSTKDVKPNDKAYFESPGRLKTMVESMRQSYQQGARGTAEDGRLMTSDWGFELGDVTFDKIRMWYGTDDENAPIRMGREMAKILPCAELKEYEGTSHLTIWVHHLEEILLDMLKVD